ncbi:hypothetical protein ACLOJK_036388 [Asimina triloba]
MREEMEWAACWVRELEATDLLACVGEEADSAGRRRRWQRDGFLMRVSIRHWIGWRGCFVRHCCPLKKTKATRLGGAPVFVHTARRRRAAWPLAAAEDGGQLLGKMEYRCMVLRQVG